MHSVSTKDLEVMGDVNMHALHLTFEANLYLTLEGPEHQAIYASIVNACFGGVPSALQPVPLFR